MSTATDAGREAVADWLAASLNRPDNAHQEWADNGVAVLALGRRFSAYRLADELVHAVGANTGPATTSLILRTLGGPVIHDPRGHRFYVLVPSSPPAQNLGPYATYLGLGNYLGVPRVEDDEPGEAGASYWAVPMKRPGALCSPPAVTGLINAGTAALTGQAD
ncbi:hypothetical protein [Streptomyces violascens]|uniref:DNA primase/polymerase bifunctional N-terminal domain-containing protein n=1 Tax=Streptomyces violascens TaxID=67381 RepID=A0ABQ3QXD4_9ACTN|nr:hypothetical protein [Streptomyces violascens]GGU13431.1 hypothetical protein GCM10010289_38910 [Streptomyces violascens]GHI41941.1 hypothetical protein Sviol_63490 [Streptomyces violascens]